MFDVINIGSATRDVFILPKEVKIFKSRKFATGRGECFPLGSKVEIKEIHFSSGGGAVNNSVTFANQGLKTGAVFRVGKDIRGDEIIRFLKKSKVNIFERRSPDLLTAYSVCISIPGGERTLFIYRGASEELSDDDIPWTVLRKTKWIYLTHLAGGSAPLFAKIVNFANAHNIKIAANPGRAQLVFGEKLKPLLNQIDVLILNREEASLLTGVSYSKEKSIFKKLDYWVRGIVLMTEGDRGAWVSDGKHRWKTGILKASKVIDKTGAGDAFGSGFVSALIKKNVGCGKGVCQIFGDQMDYALQVAGANAAGVLGKWGGNEGLLKRNESVYKFGKLKIEKFSH